MNAKTVPLEDVCEFIRDGTHSSSERVPNGIPVLSAEHVRDGGLSFDTDRFTSDKELAVFRRRLHPLPGDVLMTIVGTIGRVGILRHDRPFVFQRSVCVFRASAKSLDSMYLRYCLESGPTRRQLEQETKEVAQAGVYLDSLNGITIPIPSLGEQKRIAELLDKVDRLRRMRRYALQMCDDLRRSVVKEFCQRHSKDFSKHSFADEEIIKIIDGDRGKAYPKGTEFGKSGYCLFLNTGNVLNGAFDFSDCDFITSQKDNELRKGKLVRGDVVLTTRGTLGNNALYDTSIKHERVRINSGMVILRVNASNVLPEYLVAILNSDNFTNQVLALTSGSAQQQLPISVLSTVTLQLPSIALQQELANVLRRQQQLRATNVEALRQADHLFQTLLHQAFNDIE
jgi:restriction endonuclease S subunit